jgi:hypothetical protein
MAHMSELEPSILVIPNPRETGLDPEAPPIYIEYFQEDHVGEVVDRHGSGRRPVMITAFTGANVSQAFGGKLVVRRERISLSRLVEHTVDVEEGVPRG